MAAARKSSRRTARRLPPIDPRIVRGFSAGSAAYARSRPDYPDSARRFLTKTFHLGPGKTIVEIGAGTGKWTRQLVRTGATVVAVEPLPAMRRQLRRTAPGVRVLARRGEDTGLPGRSADLITVAQAMHWLDGPEALAEFDRVLRDGGGVAIVYNRRRERGIRGRELKVLLTKVRPKQKWDYGRESPEDLFRGNPYFGRLRRYRFRNRQLLDRQGMLDRYRSISFISALSARRQAKFFRELERILDREARRTGRDVYPIEYAGEVHWAFRKPGPLKGRGRGRSKPLR